MCVWASTTNCAPCMSMVATALTKTLALLSSALQGAQTSFLVCKAHLMRLPSSSTANEGTGEGVCGGIPANCSLNSETVTLRIEFEVDGGQ